MIKHFLTKQFLGFLFVGGFSALLHWLSRIVLSQWLPFSWAVVVAYSVGMLVAFVLNGIIIFPRSDKPRFAQARDFIIVNILFFPLVWIASIVLNHALQVWGVIYYTQAIAHGIAVALPMFATFLLYKFFAFKELSYGRS